MWYLSERKEFLTFSMDTRERRQAVEVESLIHYADYYD